MKKLYVCIIFALQSCTMQSSLRAIRERNPRPKKPILEYTNLATSEADYHIRDNLMNNIYQAMRDTYNQYAEKCKEINGPETTDHLLQNSDGSPVDRLVTLSRIQLSQIHPNQARASHELKKFIELTYAQQLYFAYRELYQVYQSEWYMPYISQRNNLLSMQEEDLT